MNSFAIENSIVVKDKIKLVEIAQSLIIFVRSEHKYSVIYSKSDSRAYLCERGVSLKQVHNHLPDLIQINRGILVNWDYAKGLHINNKELVMKGGEKLSISRRHWVQIKNKFLREKE